MKTMQAPGIRVRFEVGEKGVHRIELAANHSLKWEVAGKGTKQTSEAIEEWMHTYSLGKVPSVEVPLVFPSHIQGFTRRVVEELRKIPYGEVVTYGELARRCGCEKGARAAGGACGRNPFPLIVPCHRVVGSQKLGGFSSGGPEVKTKLIDFEGVKVSFS